MSDKLEEYVKKELRSGSSEEKVVDTLVAAGWDGEQVRSTLKQIVDDEDQKQESDKNDKEDIETTDKENETDELKVELKKNSERIRLFLFVLVIVLMTLLALGILFSFTSLDPQMIFS